MIRIEFVMTLSFINSIPLMDCQTKPAQISDW